MTLFLQSLVGFVVRVPNLIIRQAVGEKCRQQELDKDAGIHTVLYLQDFLTSFVQNPSSPPLHSYWRASLGANRSNVETKPWRQGFAEAVEGYTVPFLYLLGPRRTSYFSFKHKK